MGHLKGRTVLFKTLNEHDLFQNDFVFSEYGSTSAHLAYTFSPSKR